jgi:hypothetical protein
MRVSEGGPVTSHKGILFFMTTIKGKHMRFSEGVR